MMAATVCDHAAAYITQMSELLGKVDCEAIDALASRLFEAWQADQLVLVFGNGGSAFTASHFVTDLVKTAAVENRRRLRALSLADNVGLVTAIGNDIHYHNTFVYQLESYARSGDVAIAISASGNSPNVLEACDWAKQQQIDVVAITGFDGGRLAPIADMHINVPSTNYGIIEDLHLSVGHMVSQALRSRIANDRAVR